jgi:CHAD domain-containing protein
MSFELRREQSLRKNLRRMVRKQLDYALEQLSEDHKGPRDEAVHEARKCFKKIRAVLRLVRPEIGEKTYRMGDLLGDDHDLAVLRQMLTNDTDRYGDKGDQEVMFALIDRRRAELQQEAELLGKRFFQDRPRELARHLKGYWKTWRAQMEAGSLP